MRLPHRLTFVVFVAGTVLAAGAALLVRQRLDDDAQSLFHRNVERLSQELGLRLQRPVHELEAAAALYAVGDGRDPSRFADLVAARDLPHLEPGVLGLGFVRREPAEPSTARAPVARYITQRIEPATQHPGAVGRDHALDPRTRNAIEWAVATGRPAITARLDPVTAGGAAQLFLYVPVFRIGQPVLTSAQREAALLGLVYAPIDAAALLSGIFEVEAGRLNFELLDRVRSSTGSAADGRLFDSATDVRQPSVANDPADGPSRHAATQALTLLGRTLSLRATSTAAFDREERLAWPWWVFLGGMLCNALMVGLLWQQSSSRQRAEALAHGMTAELAQLALVAREATNAVIITDPMRRITWVNAGFERITGYAAAEVIGHSPGALLQFEGTDPQTVARIRRALDAGQAFCGDILNRHKGGHAYWLRLQIQPLHDAAGRLSGFMAVETDITELVDARREAERADLAKSEFIAMISHELRTPLQSVIGFSELGGHFAQDRPQLAQMFGDILAGGRRMLALVNGLLDVARIEGTAEAPVLRSGDLGELAAEVVHELWPQAAGRRLRVLLAADLPRLPVRVDAFRVQQVLRNVLANAIRFAPEGSAIDVSGAVAAGQVVLEVRDHGPGIPEAELETIFEPFMQSSRTRGGLGGSGLGLTISRKILRAHGGRIEAANAADGGARMRITLPAHTEVTAVAAAAAGAAPAAAPAAEPAQDEEGITA